MRGRSTTAPRLRRVNVDGAEFQQFGTSPLWSSLDQALARFYHGRLAYSNNGTGQLSRSTGGLYAFKTVDAYPPMSPPFLTG